MGARTQFSICRHWILVLRSVGRISRPLLAFAKAYILLQKEYTYTLNYDKLFSKAEFFTFVFVFVFLSCSIGDNLKTKFNFFILTENTQFLTIRIKRKLYATNESSVLVEYKNAMVRRRGDTFQG
jgi:hypothetical protein